MSVPARYNPELGDVYADHVSIQTGGEGNVPVVKGIPDSRIQNHPGPEARMNAAKKVNRLISIDEREEGYIDI